MKKTALLFALGLFALSCSVSDVSGLILTTPAAPLPSSTSTIYVTPGETATITATLPTPTFTNTPTFIYSGPTDTPSDTPLPTTTVGALTSNGAALTPQLGFGFSSVQISGELILYGKCQPNSVKFSATVTDPANVATVTIWVRLVDTITGEYTDWGGGAIMDGDNRGNFTYDYGFASIPHYHDFLSAYVQYQLVAKNSQFKDLGRTQPYLHNILLKPCL